MIFTPLRILESTKQELKAGKTARQVLSSYCRISNGRNWVLFLNVSLGPGNLGLALKLSRFLSEELHLLFEGQLCTI